MKIIIFNRDNICFRFTYDKDKVDFTLSTIINLSRIFSLPLFNFYTSIFYLTRSMSELGIPKYLEIIYQLGTNVLFTIHHKSQSFIKQNLWYARVIPIDCNYIYNLWTHCMILQKLKGYFIMANYIILNEVV